MTEVALGSPDVKDHAKWFVDHNVSVVPIKGKTPIGKNGVKDAKLSTDGITDGYGIALGNGIIGIDYDIYDGASGIEAFTPTRAWVSGSGKGYGLLYKVPVELSNYTFKLPGMSGITIRGCGSIIVGPGSVHPGNPKNGTKPGGIYTLQDDIEIADAPEFILEFIKNRATRPTGSDVKIGNYLEPTWLYKDTRWVQKFNTKDITDRSAQTFDIAAYSAERGANNEELAWTIANFKPAIDKGHLDKEIPRVIEKIREKHPHEDLACDEDNCPNTPAWMKKELEVFDFWTARPMFAEIKQAAESQQVAPRALMLSVLAHIAASTPPEVVLPGLIGSRKGASLNFFVCFVGKPGSGKGAVTGLASELYDYSQTGISFNISSPGSGEGLSSSYNGTDDKGKKLRKHVSALINYPEIDNLAAASDRKGSTLSSQLRQGFSGETLGAQLSTRNTEVAHNSYRMALQLAAQPVKGEWLLSDCHGGLPQRFVYVETSNSQRPELNDIPGFPTITPWIAPPEIIELNKHVPQEIKPPNAVFGKLEGVIDPVVPEKKTLVIGVCDKIKSDIRIARQDSLDEKEGELEGHALLVRFKVATWLAIYDGRINVNEEDWQLSYVIMSWSKQALNKIRDAISKQHLVKQKFITENAIHRAIAVENGVENQKIERLSKNAMNHIKNGVTKVRGTGGIKQKLGRDGATTPDVINHLVEKKLITYDESTDLISPLN
jgi:hypothetical protein